MKFYTFLETTLTSGHNPSTQLKIDLSVWKDTFNFATKTDELYDSLINNIITILITKFKDFNIVYSNVDKMYDELKLVLIPQLPQFLMIQKKQLLENLNIFAELNNWGDNVKNSVIRTLNLQDDTTNNSGFVPIDGEDKDPYSTNDGVVKRTGTDANSANSNMVNYLEYYKLIKWNVADLEIQTILKPYYKLFVLYDSDVQLSSSSSSIDSDDLQQQIDNLKHVDEMLAIEIDTNTRDIEELKHKTDVTNGNVAVNSANIEQLQQTVGTNSTNIVDLSNRVTTIETTYPKLDSNNEWEGGQWFNNQVNFRGDFTIRSNSALYSRMDFTRADISSLVNKYYVDTQDSALNTKINDILDFNQTTQQELNDLSTHVDGLESRVNNQASSLNDLNTKVTSIENDINDILNPQLASYEYSISRLEALGGLVRYQEWNHTYPEGKTLSYANILVDLQVGFANVMDAATIRKLAYEQRNGFCRLMVSPTFANETNAWYGGMQISWNLVDSEHSTCISIRVFKPYDELIAQDKDYIKNNLVVGLYEYI